MAQITISEEELPAENDMAAAEKAAFDFISTVSPIGAAESDGFKGACEQTQNGIHIKTNGEIDVTIPEDEFDEIEAGYTENHVTFEENGYIVVSDAAIAIIRELSS